MVWPTKQMAENHYAVGPHSFVRMRVTLIAFVAGFVEEAVFRLADHGKGSARQLASSANPLFALQFFSSGPIVCMVWEGKDVVKQGRQMMVRE